METTLVVWSQENEVGQVIELKKRFASKEKADEFIAYLWDAYQIVAAKH